MPVFRKGSVWYARVELGGRRVERSAGKGAKRQDAVRLETKIRQDLIKSRLGEKPEFTIAEAMSAHIDEGVAKDTIGHIRAMLPYIEGRLLKDAHIVAREIRVDMLAKGLAPATVVRRLAVLRAVANKAYKEWEWLDDPVGQRIKMPKVQNERHVYLEPAQVRELAEACPHPDVGKMILVAAYTGLRKGELLRVNEGEAVCRDGLLMLDAKTKTGKPRVIPVPEEVEAIVAEMPLPVSAQILKTNWQKATMACGMEDVRWHDLRHTYASWLVQAKVPLRTVQELMGHTTMAMTQRYSHLADDHLREAVEMMRRSQASVQNRGSSA
ncbi:tyrosine-type recombinase/integrase [Spiribacter insolitus]|uniref:Site-specific integrase n=1 Tax=Spiribacter insolitus TaxID=3122417 RepID=A0ABV3T5T8_9GAMM